MIGAIAKIVAAFLDLPALWQRWRLTRQARKIHTLQVEISEKDAKVVVESLRDKLAEKQAEKTQEVKNEAKTKSLSDIAKHFRYPSS